MKAIIKERPTVTIKKHKRWNYDKLQLGEIKWSKQEKKYEMNKKDPEKPTFWGVKDQLFIADYLIFCQPESSTRDQAPGTNHPQPSIRNEHDTEYAVKAIIKANLLWLSKT